MTRSIPPLAFAMVLTACSGVAVEGEGEGGAGGEATTSTTSETTTSTTSSSSGAGGSGASTTSSSSGSGGGGGTCETAPDYSDDCSQVPTFQCGVMPSCDGTTITMEWHEHVMCDGVEEIVDYACTYLCPGGCIADYAGWPDSGQAFIDEACLPAAS